MDAAVDELVARGFVSQERLDLAREVQKQKKNTDQSLCEILVKSGFLDKGKFVDFIGTHLDVPVIDPNDFLIPHAVSGLIPAYLARQYILMPFEKQGDRLRVVMADPREEAALLELQSQYPGEIEICIGVDERIARAIVHHYTTKDLKSAPVSKVEVMSYQSGDKVADVEGTGEEVVNIVNNLILIAMAEKATDIHLDPIAAGLMIRLRVDGDLHELETLDKSLQAAVVSRVKVIGDLNIAEKRVPQDGRTRVMVGNKTVDLRIATYPTMWGEKVSIRTLSKDVYTSFDALGLSKRDQELFEKIILQPHGLLLVTGPTGSGKTTTLYSAFMRISRRDRHAISIEDPIENEIVGVNQAQVNAKAGVSFAAALRAMLRNDPDIILVGEIRDGETADTTARAAMTGHLVFSTLHTNSAVGVITRLQDLGLAPYLIASSLIGIVAQRLVRRICVHCREEYRPSEDELMLVKGAVTKFFRGKGCENCRGTGFSGRLGLYEIVAVEDDTRHKIGQNLSEREIAQHFRKQGFHSMWEDGIEKIAQGITTLSEVFRVCRAEEL